WEFEPDDRPAADWLPLAEVQSGRRFDAAGAVVALSPEELQTRWDDLCRRYPGDTRCTPGQEKGWCWQEAVRCWEQKQPEDAREVLGHAVAAWPDDPSLRRWRGWLAGQVKRPDQALDDLRRAAAGQPHHWPEVAKRYQQAGKVEEGVQELSGRLAAA